MVVCIAVACAFDGERVTFPWKDDAHGDQSRTMTLPTMEFLRRFVQHVLPRGFVRIRHFGYLATACRTARLALARTVLAQPAPAPARSNDDPPGDQPAAGDTHSPTGSPRHARRTARAPIIRTRSPRPAGPDPGLRLHSRPPPQRLPSRLVIERVAAHASRYSSSDSRRDTSDER